MEVVMRKLLLSALLFLSFSGISLAQENGAIHGTVPTARAVRVGLADLQTPEGQEWYDGLQAMVGHREQTDYVCRTEPPMATTAQDEQFDFYDLPPGSYVASACLQNDEGGWYEGSAIVQVKEGQTSDVIFGDTTAPRYHAHFIAEETVIVGFYEPFWGFDVCIGCWHYGYVWYYRPYVYRCAPVWLTPGVIVVERPVYIPREYHYREHPYYRRGGSFAPPHQEYHRDGYLPPAYQRPLVSPHPQVQPHPHYQSRPQVQPRPQVHPQYQRAEPKPQYHQEEHHESHVQPHSEPHGGSAHHR
jgi:hypothetical protein